MRSFEFFETRDRYSVGCTGQSVYVYENSVEVARIKGFRYTYKSSISPKLDYFALKSNEGIMYIYSLNDFSLVTKKRFAKASLPQDHNFTFSLSGEEIISVDEYKACHNCISYYSVPDLELKKRLFDDSDVIEPVEVELSEEDNSLYAVFWERGKDGCVCNRFVALIKNDKIVKKTDITKSMGRYL